ncbi:MAG: N-acetylmuramoyl-L-alanine amidase [Bacilli bacterium]|nr:N-acetylmuramoyl-L-alanine amidase [Bacilli bacterium]
MKNLRFLFLIFVFCATFFATLFLYIDKAKGINSNCIFCNGSSTDYEEEKQLIERVKTLKQKYGNSIDEVTLLATVLHKEGAEQAITSRYDENDKNLDNYKEKVSIFDSIFGGSSGEGTTTTVDENWVKEMSDLLDAAALIMNNASSGGSFNEEAYKAALVSDGSAACALKIPSILDFFKSIINMGDNNDEDSIADICTKGYIEAVYDLEGLDDETKEIRKMTIAENIIDLAHYYKAMIGVDDDTCVVQPNTSGNFSSWKQYDEKWKNEPLGGETLGGVGCLVTSMAIQIARSGTMVTNLPSGYSNFNPGAFAKALNDNGAFSTGGSFSGGGYSGIVPNWKTGSRVSVNTSDNASLAQKLSAELASAAEGKYQKFILLQIHHSSSDQHWVAVDTVTSNEVTIFDPGKSGTTLDENYNNWVVDSYTVYYATDVLQGQTGSSTSAAASTVTPADPNSFKNFVKDNFLHGDLPKEKVKYIMLHDTESGTDSAETIISNWGNGHVASHFIVAKDGTIYQTVPINKIAHHAGWAPTGSNDLFGITEERDDKEGSQINGDYAMNAWSIGIEIIHEHDGSEYPEAQLNAVDSLISYIDKELGLQPEIIDHKEWTGSAETSRIKQTGEGKQDVDSSMPLSQYKSTRTHNGSTAGSDVCGGNQGIQKVMEFIRNGEGYAADCNYKGKGEGTGYSASKDGADRHDVGFTTGYGFTEKYMQDEAVAMGYTTFVEDIRSGCTDKEYIDKIAEKYFSGVYDIVKAKFDEASGGKILKEHQYHSLIYLYNHYPVGLNHVIEEIANVDPYSYEVYASYQKWNGLGGSCGGYNGHELMYHLWYNGNYNAVRDYPCAQPTRAYWEERIKIYNSEQITN